MNAYPSWGGLTRLPRVVGRQTAKRVALMGDVLDGNAALNCGLADMVVDDGTTLSSAKAIAEKMAPDINREVFSTSKRVLLESEDLTTRSLHEINRLLESSLQFTGES
jgi:enoyl-CoA hydratase/carnithine racemase